MILSYSVRSLVFYAKSVIRGFLYYGPSIQCTTAIFAVNAADFIFFYFLGVFYFCEVNDSGFCLF
jgi:hypothetical protein